MAAGGIIVLDLEMEEMSLNSGVVVVRGIRQWSGVAAGFESWSDILFIFRIFAQKIFVFVSKVFAEK